MKIKLWTETDRLERIEAWARRGLSNGEIASNMGISSSSLSRALKQYPKIENAIEKGREVANILIENALFKAALGYEVEEYDIDSNGYKKGHKRHVPGCVTAQIFWLKKRLPSQWGDNNEANEDTMAKLKEVLDNIKGNI